MTESPKTWYLLAARLLALLILASVLPIVPLYATPIDPSLPVGFYDNGDFDDVIDFIVSGFTAVTPRLPVSFAPREAVVGHALQAEPTGQLLLDRVALLLDDLEVWPEELV